MAEQWFLAKIFYSMPDLESPEDPHGDQLIVDVIKPILDNVINGQWVRWGHFMRFSEEGYHIRLTLYGDEEVLSGRIAPLAHETIQTYRTRHPERAHTPMQLSPLAQRLNRKWGGSKETFQLYSPEATLMGIARDYADMAAFESWDAYAAHHRLHTESCKHITAFLATSPPRKLRLTLIRLLMDDLLRLTDLSALERFCFLSYLKQQWIDYFELDQETLHPYLQFHGERADRYHAYFERKRGPEDSLALLPEGVRPFYTRWIADLETQLPAINARTSDGHLTPYSSLRLLSFFHLTHNRLGVGLLQEIYLAHVLEHYYRAQLTPQQIADAEQWAHVLSERAQTPDASASTRR